ncbi:hypothetical protein AVEN_169269-1 [Araneus ventricosus]|uniref:Uncharacterized protein n=1 Tax=Araneus ventricosus TaxID=182803 RepID=A0A4Y2U8K2_ARAVE|nr:hypothetical protein AVEN_241013-1 [Araneus ventricosus]GBO08833.1 hypothetical protein AVEN_169269-1 [Araneus ventricosus]
MTRTTPEQVSPSPNIRTTPAGGRLTHDVRFNMHQAHIHGGSSMESVSNVKRPGPKAETLSLSHRGLPILVCKQNVTTLTRCSTLVLLIVLPPRQKP